MAENQGTWPVCVSVINMKGGVGKTTIAALLAHRLATQRRTTRFTDVRGPFNTLAIDLDPQANLSQALMGATGYERFLKSGAPSIVEVFKRHQPATQSTVLPRTLAIENVVQEVTPYLDIIPSRFDFSNNLAGAIGPDPKVLAQIIADKFQDKELIIIDCAPTESVLTQAAYHASRYILVPVKPEFLATIGFPLLNESLEAFKDSNPDHQIDVLGVVINETFDYQADDRMPERKISLSEIHQEAAKNGWYVFRSGLQYSRGFPKMMRGDWSNPGNAPDIFEYFEGEFLMRLADLTGLEFL